MSYQADLINITNEEARNKEYDLQNRLEQCLNEKDELKKKYTGRW